MMSLALPAVNGLTTRTGRVGHSCAPAADPPAITTAIVAHRALIHLMVSSQTARATVARRACFSNAARFRTQRTSQSIDMPAALSGAPFFSISGPMMLWRYSVDWCSGGTTNVPVARSCSLHGRRIDRRDRGVMELFDDRGRCAVAARRSRTRSRLRNPCPARRPWAVPGSDGSRSRLSTAIPLIRSPWIGGTAVGLSVTK